MIRYPNKETMRCTDCGKLMYPVMHEEKRKGSRFLVCHGLRCGRCRKQILVENKDYFVVKRTHIETIICKKDKKMKQIA